MKNWLLWVGLLLSSLLLAACGQATPLATQIPANLPTATARAVTPTADLRPTRTPSQAPTPTQAKVVDYCVDCHTSKDTLIKNLKPVEAKADESEGTG